MVLNHSKFQFPKCDELQWIWDMSCLLILQACHEIIMISLTLHLQRENFKKYYYTIIPQNTSMKVGSKWLQMTTSNLSEYFPLKIRTSVLESKRITSLLYSTGIGKGKLCVKVISPKEINFFMKRFFCKIGFHISWVHFVRTNCNIVEQILGSKWVFWIKWYELFSNKGKCINKPLGRFSKPISADQVPWPDADKICIS